MSWIVKTMFIVKEDSNCPAALNLSCVGSHQAAFLGVPGPYTKRRGIRLHLAVTMAFDLSVHVAFL